MAQTALFDYALRNLVGCQVEVFVKGGSKLSGVFLAQDDPKKGIHIEEVDYERRKSHVRVVPLGDLIQIYAKDVKDQISATGPSGARSHALATDADIAQSHSHLSGRELQRAHPAWVSEHVDGGLDDGGDRGTWNQFEANERLGVKTTYREDLYTSVLDVSKMTPEQIEHATRIAKEIEGNTQADSLHALEERGIAVDAGLTEEERYSGVLRGKPGMYVPPQRRTVPQARPAGNNKSYASAVAATTTAPAAAPSQPNSKLPHREQIRAVVPADEESRRETKETFKSFSENLDKQKKPATRAEEGGASEAPEPPAPASGPAPAPSSPGGSSLVEILRKKNVDLNTIKEFKPAFSSPPAVHEAIPEQQHAFQPPMYQQIPFTVPMAMPPQWYMYQPEMMTMNMYARVPPQHYQMMPPTHDVVQTISYGPSGDTTTTTYSHPSSSTHMAVNKTGVTSEISKTTPALPPAAAPTAPIATHAPAPAVTTAPVVAAAPVVVPAPTPAAAPAPIPASAPVSAPAPTPQQPMSWSQVAGKHGGTAAPAATSAATNASSAPAPASNTSTAGRGGSNAGRGRK